MHAQSFVATLLLAATGASAAAVKARQEKSQVVEIQGWNATSDCVATEPTYNFNVDNSTVGQSIFTCGQLPASIPTVRVPALHENFQISFFTDENCEQLITGTTVNVPGSCLNNAIGDWKSFQLSKF